MGRFLGVLALWAAAILVADVILVLAVATTAR